MGGVTRLLEPFELPSEEEWAALRLAEAGKREAQRARLAALPIHAKSTLASRMQALVDPDTGPISLRVLLQGMAGCDQAVAAEVGGGGGGASGAIAAALPADLYMRRTGDNVRDMLAKKRQIFLVQVRRYNEGWEMEGVACDHANLALASHLPAPVVHPPHSR